MIIMKKDIIYHEIQHMLILFTLGLSSVTVASFMFCSNEQQQQQRTTTTNNNHHYNYNHHHYNHHPSTQRCSSSNNNHFSHIPKRYNHDVCYNTAVSKMTSSTSKQQHYQQPSSSLQQQQDLSSYSSLLLLHAKQTTNGDDSDSEIININDDASSSLSYITRIKNHIKSYHKYETEDPLSIIRRLEPYVKYPFRVVRSYLRSEPQQDDIIVDGFNDIIISNNISQYDDNDNNDNMLLSSTSQIMVDSSSSLSDSIITITTTTTATKTAPTKTTTTRNTTTDTAATTNTTNVIRSDVAPIGINLSGKWNIIVNDEFKKQYDIYLSKLGQPFIVRSIAIQIVSMTTEITAQKDNELYICGENVRGIWERTLISSSAQEPILIPIKTIDKENVISESWWDHTNNGGIHHSWLRGITKYGGGNFESKRYMDDNDILVCETTFHPNDSTQEKAYITWRFIRDTN